VRRTPVTFEGLRQYDNLPPEEAVRLAWTRPGPRPDWHAVCVAEIRASMPLLARALDRLGTASAESATPTEDNGG
jgi:hypothetical protein